MYPLVLDMEISARLKNEINNGSHYHLINAYFYNNHDIQYMIKWSNENAHEWDYMLMVYKTDIGTMKMKKFPITKNYEDFEIYYPDDADHCYPIKALLVPNEGNCQKYNVKCVSEIPEIIGEKQIFW